jgi:NTE family protein
MLNRWVYDLFISKVTKKLLLTSILDAAPLSQTLLTHTHFWKINRAIREGKIHGLAVSTTNYHNGTTTIFFDSHENSEGWERAYRIGIRTNIKLKHIMASCSIPILFEPVRIGDFFYGDGALRFNFPFSPAIKLGANKILAVGIRCPKPVSATTNRPEQARLGFIAGAVLNSIFLDSIDLDYENLLRINRLKSRDTTSVDAFLIRPSQDLGALAKGHIEEVPFHLRQILKSTANPDELGDLLSYLMFSPAYIRKLLELGEKDALAQKETIQAFIDKKPEGQSG